MIACLVESEWEDRQPYYRKASKNARFRYKAALEQLNYTADRNLDRNQIMRFAARPVNIR